MNIVRTGLVFIACAAFPAAAVSQTPREELDAAFKKGNALQDQGKHNEAIAFYEKALALAPKVFGPEHLDTAGITLTLARCNHKANRIAEAEPLYRRALAIFEAKLGKDHPSLASTLYTLGMLNQEMKRFKDAEPFYERCLQIYAVRPLKDTDTFLSALNNLAVLNRKKGTYEKAEALYLQGLKFSEDRKMDIVIGTFASNLAELYWKMGRLNEAERMGRRSVAIRESKLGNTHHDLALSLNQLGLIYRSLGRHDEAVSCFERCLSMHDANPEKNILEMISALNNLAMLYQDMGRFADAETALRRNLAAQEKILGADHADVAITLNNLAHLYRAIGRRQEAEALLRRSLDISERRLGPAHAEVAVCLNNLAGLWQAMGRLEDAEGAFRRALEIKEKQFGKDHIELTSVLNNLGALYKRMKRYDDALTFHKRCLAILERVDKDHPKLADTHHNLGTLYWVMGRFAEAEGLLTRALQLVELRRGKNHPHAGTTWNALAAVQHAQGRHEQALQSQEQSLRIEQANLRNVFAFSSEAAMHAYLQTTDGTIPILVTMAWKQYDDAAAGTALTWTLRRKGIILDTLCRFRQTQHFLTPHDPLTQRVKEYRSLKESLANAALNPPSGLSREQRAAQMDKWRKEMDDLERELNLAFSKKSGGLMEGSEAISMAAVRKSLPPGSALIEFVRAPVRDFQRGIWKEDRYFAFVLSADRPLPMLLDIARAKDIDAGVEAVRREFTDFQEKLRECESPEEALALEKAQEKQFVKASAALYRRLFAPLHRAVGRAKLVYVAADGTLNRLPFEALVDTDGKYLIESYRFAYLSSGRDLLRPALKPAAGTVVFAGPDYKLDAAERLAQADKLLKKAETVALRGAGKMELRSAGWKALPGVAAEAKEIHKLLDGTAYGPVQSYVGPQALEDVLKAMSAPRVLHLATHGFFIDHEPAAPAADDGPGVGAGATRGRLRQIDHPFLRSGIVLAGANTIGDKSSAKVEDGWVTAEEIALLNLRGTELVVLSACQTGLGDVKTGEGVYGLRRAFLYAGARTLVTSLFEVPDTETRELMTRFYAGLRTGQSKLTALHTAECDLLRQRRQANGAAHPFFWASFVLVGSPD
jgi:CHAT domain-containing protein/Tfp pilus assembly protein PilF